MAGHLAIVLLCAVAGLLICAGSASAARPYEGQITETEFSEPLEGASAVAVDSADHLWVTETPVEGGIVDKYSPTGSWEAHTASPPWDKAHNLASLAFDAADAKIFVSDSNNDALWGLDPADASYAGPELKPLGATTGQPIRVAADNSGGPYDGDLYVFGERHVIRIDGATGAPVDFTEGSSAGTNELSGADTPNCSFGGFIAGFGAAVAVDAVGHLWVADSHFLDGLPNVIDEFTPSGRYLRTITETGPSEPLGEQLALAIDPTTGNLLASASKIDEFTPAGAFIEPTTSPTGGGLVGLAADSTGKLYVAGALPEEPGPPVVDVFGPAGPPVPKRSLEVEVTGEGEVSGPAGIACTQALNGSGACKGEFTEAAEVPLSATPAAGYGLAEWVTVEGDAGSCAGATASCETAALTETTKLKAVFVPTHRLRVAISGAGEVNSSPAGIDGCEAAAGTCEASFNDGTVVTLSANPASGSKFSGWTGGGCSGTGTCQITLSADAGLTATFTKILTTPPTSPGTPAPGPRPSPAQPARLRIRHVHIRVVRIGCATQAALIARRDTGRCAKLRVGTGGTIAKRARGVVDLKAKAYRRGRQVTAATRAQIMHGRWHGRLALPGINRRRRASIFIIARFAGSPGVKRGQAKRRIRLTVNRHPRQHRG